MAITMKNSKHAAPIPMYNKLFVINVERVDVGGAVPPPAGGGFSVIPQFCKVLASIPPLMFP